MPVSRQSSPQFKIQDFTGSAREQAGTEDAIRNLIYWGTSGFRGERAFWEWVCIRRGARSPQGVASPSCRRDNGTAFPCRAQHRRRRAMIALFRLPCPW